MSVNDPCVSISTGTLSPDLRVNYAYGMVLGLGEFLQEQQYFLQKDYLHERALHGFGTAYGLQVATAPTVGVAGDFTVSVAPGMAVDQWGREVVVRTTQCARLGAWLGAQEQANPGTIAANLGPSAEFTVYVVAKYAECLDDLVPLPGQPCSSSEQTKVASRIRDAWNIELRWSPPPMPEWDTDRRLARLLNAVQIVTGLDPSLSSEAEIIEAIRALPMDVKAGPSDLWPLVNWPTVSDAPSGPVVWRLPAETANEALDRIFTIWVTQVRPQLSPDLTSPPDTWDAAVLLSSISFTLGPLTSSPGSDPVIASCEEPDDDGRPFLLHTRLIQELRVLSAAATAVTKAQELVTLTSEVDPSGLLTLTAWFHLDQPVALTEPIQFVSRGGVYGSLAPAAAPDPSGARPAFSDVWLLTPRSEYVPVDGDQLAVTFIPESVLVGDLSTSLAARVDGGLDLIDTTPAGHVVAYATVDVPQPPVVEPPPPQQPVLEFVTVVAVRPGDGDDDFFADFWFHPRVGLGPKVVVRELEPELITYFEESDQATLGQANGTFSNSDNVWSGAFQSTFGPEAGYLRFMFYAPKILVAVSDPSDPRDPGEQMSLVEWMEKAGVTFLDWDPSGQMISAYAYREAPLR